ncbi:MAG: hypothetical protein II776_04240, partial [Clostridia bacterium]|nr:hypothetical protein [Clostridia bacterium]
GTMTHWYSRTPEVFLERMKPAFLPQANRQYLGSDTGRVFDFREEKWMDAYMRLTETMVREYGKRTDLFHTIGLGERKISADPAENLAFKLAAYRAICENVFRRWPEATLYLASWDFVGYWEPEDVRRLLSGMDPERCVLLDYAGETSDPKYSFLSWGVVGKFPWIFGLFHAYESESELRGPYDRSDERLRVAKDDPFCRGMILWPELAHSDPLILEYLAANAWAPLQKSVEEIARDFSFARYGDAAERMNACWQTALPLIKLGDWNCGGEPRDVEPDGPCRSRYTHRDLWPRLPVFLTSPEKWKEKLVGFYADKKEKTLPLLPAQKEMILSLADGEILSRPFALRDAVDLARTVLSRVLNLLAMEALRAVGDGARERAIGARYKALLAAMEDLLALTDDFSLYATLCDLKKTAPVNPDFEITLKRNVSNPYCAQPVLELVREVFRPEAEAVFALLETARETPPLQPVRDGILKAFEEKPLAAMGKARPEAKTTFIRAADA